MWKNHFKIAFRNLLKYKGYSSINLLGLAFSMALCMVMLLFVREQLSRDDFHANGDRIYRVISHVQFPNNKMDLATSPKGMAEALQSTYTGIEQAITMRRLSSNGTAGDRTFALRGLFVEPGFFDLFSFPLRHGDAATALSTPNGVILSQEKAQAFFGDENPLGKSISIQDGGDFIVTGVLAKQTRRTHLQFDVLVPLAALPADPTTANSVQEWTNSTFRYYTYFLLEEKARPDQIEQALAEIAAVHYPTDLPGTYSFRLQALDDINLGPNLSNKIGTKAPNELIYAMAALVVLIMLVAGFNYVNLTVARAMKRSLEIGIRKVIGARRLDIVRQMLGEAVFFAFLSATVAVLLLEYLIPAFNSLSVVGTDSLRIDPAALGDPQVYLLFAAFAAVVGLLAGLSPSLILSRAKPVFALQGIGKGQRPTARRVRKTLLILQFALSFIFIAFTLQLQRQVTYMLNEDYGFNREHIINVELQETVSHEAFRNEALALPEVIDVSAASILPMSGEREMTVFQSAFLDKPVGVLYYSVDGHFVPNLGLQIIAGQNFVGTPDKQLLLNEAAAQRLGFADPEAAIGQRISSGDGAELTVMGVVKNFHFESLGNAIEPLILTYKPELFSYANVRVQAGSAPAVAQKLEQIWRALDKVHPFRYAFFDAQIEANYAEYADSIRLLGLTSGLVVLIAGLGLLGIATYKIEAKTKEIGIRKVLGASVASVVNLLSMDFFKLVLWANVLAGPVAWLLLQATMQQFAFRVGIGWWVFAVAGGLALLIALLTVATQAVRAALANPVESLRYE